MVLLFLREMHFPALRILIVIDKALRLIPELLDRQVILLSVYYVIAMVIPAGS